MVWHLQICKMGRFGGELLGEVETVVMDDDQEISVNSVDEIGREFADFSIDELADRRA